MHWPGDIFWRPDGPGPGGPDFPPRIRLPALSRSAAAGPARVGPASVPWLSCFGNHEGLNQGVGIQTPDLAGALTGDRKPTGLAADFDHDRALELHTERPEMFMAGQFRHVTPDPFRRPITGAISSTLTFGPVRGHSGTGSASATGWMGPLTTPMTRPRCDSSPLTPLVWPAGSRLPRPSAGPLARVPAHRGALGLPRIRWQRSTDSPSGPAGDPGLPSRDRHTEQHPRRSRGPGGEPRWARPTCWPCCIDSPMSFCG